MQSGRRYAYKGEPDTCRWCGRKLIHKPTKLVWKEKIVRNFDDDGLIEGSHDAGRHVAVGRVALGGAYRDGFFCGLRCGYDYAVTQLSGRIP